MTTEITDGTAKFKVLSMTGINNRLTKMEESGGVLPGTVTAFSGTFKGGYPVDKKTGLADQRWHLCDGTNGTPDLRKRFIYGGNETNKGATGGEATHQLSVQELPVFTPAIRTSMLDSNPKSANLWHGNRNCVAAGWDDIKMSTGPCDSIGGGQPHNNMPPYYVLAFIMRL